MADGTFKEYAVEDYAWRMYKHLGGDVTSCRPGSSPRWKFPPPAHKDMVAAVAPYIDTSISKTVNVPADYPYADFEDLYLAAWKAGLKGLATYRPNSVLGSVLSVDAPKTEEKKQPHDVDIITGANQRLSIGALPAPVLSSLRWPGRPDMTDGNPSWTYMLKTPGGEFALFVGHIENEGADGRMQTLPFEVWVNGADQPRGLGAVAKTLSMDMRANDPGWLKLKLDVLARNASDQGFDMPMPPSGETRRMPGVVAAFANVIRYRCDKLGALEREAPTPVLDTLFALQEPKTGTDGTLSWTVDISNPATGEDFVLGLKEITLPGGETRPYSVWLSGNYPRALDGLTRILALDMRVMDPAWIGMKLRKLHQLPGTAGRLHGLRARHPPPAELADRPSPTSPAHHPPLRHARHPRRSRLPDARNGHPRVAARRHEPKLMQGALCGECGNQSVIRKDGCDFCTACGAVGSCGFRRFARTARAR
jgi:ribonucleoside-diphosphate reductase alpha chain